MMQPKNYNILSFKKARHLNFNCRAAIDLVNSGSSYLDTAPLARSLLH